MSEVAKTSVARTIAQASRGMAFLLCVASLAPRHLRFSDGPHTVHALQQVDGDGPALTLQQDVADAAQTVGVADEFSCRLADQDTASKILADASVEAFEPRRRIH